MLRRIAPLFPSLPSFGWFFLGWAMLAHASTGVFAFALASSATKWLGENAWVGFIGGFALLALAVLWPEVGPWIQKYLSVPKTSGERLRTIEDEHIPTLKQGHIDVGKRLEIDENELHSTTLIAKAARESVSELSRSVDGAKREFSKRCGLVEMGWSETVATLAPLKDLPAETHSAHSRIDEHKWWLQDLERRILSQEKITQMIPHRTLYEVELTEVIQELWHGITWFVRFRREHPESTITKNPFLTGWRPSRPDQDIDDLTKEADRWALQLERSVKRAQIFASRWNLPAFQGELIVFVSTWKVNQHDTPGERLIVLLQEFSNELRAMRNTYAASWEVEAGLAKATISWMDHT